MSATEKLGNKELGQENRILTELKDIQVDLTQTELDLTKSSINHHENLQQLMDLDDDFLQSLTRNDYQKKHSSNAKDIGLVTRQDLQTYISEKLGTNVTFPSDGSVIKRNEAIIKNTIGKDRNSKYRFEETIKALKTNPKVIL